ncbi:restriction system modified-DNA reader domain-containing protein [Salininema proteolyticum]|uniref:RAMA domain-containing protein n=1 Tax=Salininema proteolyticum TaxID=1607685 RepID=A0ABV8TSU9_9ACTN
MPHIEVSDRVYRHIQENAVPLEDTADTVLARLLGLDAARKEAAVPKQGAAPEAESDLSGSSTRRVRRVRRRKGGDGALKPLLDAGYVFPGDKLVWKRGKKGVTHRATVEANGNMKLSTGEEFDTPSGAASSVAGRRYPGWDKWTHQRSKKALSVLKRQFERGDEPPKSVRPKEEQSTEWHSAVNGVLDAIPPASWTSFKDLGELVDKHPRSVSHYVENSGHSNAHLVMQQGGAVTPSFLKDDSQDVFAKLRDAGIILNEDGTASANQRLRVMQLKKLVGENESEPEHAEK